MSPPCVAVYVAPSPVRGSLRNGPPTCGVVLAACLAGAGHSPIPSHPIPSHPIPSHPIPSHPITTPPQHRGAGMV